MNSAASHPLPRHWLPVHPPFLQREPFHEASRHRLPFHAALLQVSPFVVAWLQVPASHGAPVTSTSPASTRSPSVRCWVPRAPSNVPRPVAGGKLCTDWIFPASTSLALSSA